jgi:hypothetical protein
MTKDGKWGHCRSCKFFASPAQVPLGSEEARCMHPVLEKFTLTVYGSCGCSGWDLRTGLPESIEDRPAARI